MKIILGLILALSLNAGFLKGTDLAKYKTEYEKMYKKNKKIDFYKVGAYVYYILGVFNTMADSVICVKRGTTEKEILDTVGKYIDDHPEQLNNFAQDLVIKSLMNAFPCVN